MNFSFEKFVFFFSIYHLRAASAINCYSTLVGDCEWAPEEWYEWYGEGQRKWDKRVACPYESEGVKFVEDEFGVGTYGYLFRKTQCKYEGAYVGKCGALYNDEKRTIQLGCAYDWAYPDGTTFRELYRQVLHEGYNLGQYLGPYSCTNALGYINNRSPRKPGVGYLCLCLGDYCNKDSLLKGPFGYVLNPTTTTTTTTTTTILTSKNDNNKGSTTTTATTNNSYYGITTITSTTTPTPTTAIANPNESNKVRRGYKNYRNNGSCRSPWYIFLALTAIGQKLVMTLMIKNSS